MSAPIELLHNVPLFKGLNEKSLKNLASEFTERKFSEGQELTAEGSGGAGFFVIESGTAKVTVDGEDRRTLGPRDFYGEVALIDGGTRTATITALSEGVAYGLHHPRVRLSLPHQTLYPLHVHSQFHQALAGKKSSMAGLLQKVL